MSDFSGYDMIFITARNEVMHPGTFAVHQRATKLLLTELDLHIWENVDGSVSVMEVNILPCKPARFGWRIRYSFWGKARNQVCGSLSLHKLDFLAVRFLGWTRPRSFRFFCFQTSRNKIACLLEDFSFLLQQ